MIVDFSKQWDFLTPLEDLTFNVPAGSEDWLYLLLEEACSGKVARIRVDEDDVPQGDGSILHSRWTSGYQLTLSVALMQDRETPACDEVLFQMGQRLSGALRSTLRTQEGRMTFEEGDGPVRLVDQVRLNNYAHSKDGPIHSIVFTLDSPFPYSITFTQDVIMIDDGTEEIFNEGNVEFWPVMQVYGPETLFVIENTTLGKSITYDSSRPGAQSIPGGSYAEFDFFKNTVYMNGDGADLAPGIDPTVSDFFPLTPGSNFINTTCTDLWVLKNDAWD
jgi:hypothetical protein